VRGVVVRHITFGGQKILALKVPRQCPFVPLVDVPLRQSKISGGEKDKEFGCGLCYEQRREFEQGFIAYD
jgi:hypothetical protein